MSYQTVSGIILTLLTVTLIQCHSSITNTIKLSANDPFKNTIVPGQTIEIDSKQDNVVEGENGTVIVCPKGCFKNGKGEVVEGKVNIELSEALKLEDMVLSNLTTTSDGKLLETDGMIYFNATVNGEQLTINKDIPVHIEIPTAKKKPGMMAYKGIRDEKGNMNWAEPKELDNYIVTVDINSLDFLPDGFQAEVDKGMPFGDYKTATKNLTDSLYYSLSFNNGAEQLHGFVPANYNEPYYNKNKKVENGKYTSDSYILSEADTMKKDSSRSGALEADWGINPAIIKVIKSEKYQHTFIATREFEARLKVIFKTCRDSVLEIYIDNLDKNLFELDSMAALAVRETRYYHDFYDFSLQKLTRVKNADKYSELLKGFYKKQLAKVQTELERQKEKLIKTLNNKNEEAQKTADGYKNLLWKREQYRMETYGFNWTSTGWLNIDKGTLEKEWSNGHLEITVENGKQFDRVYTYVVYTSIKSLYRLNTDNNEQFYAGNNEDKEMLMPKKKTAVAIAIGYKDENPSLAIKEFETGSEQKFSMTLSSSTLKKVKEAIKLYERYEQENKISKDLEYMAKFYKEEQRQKELIEESEFIKRLTNVAHPCLINGEVLFYSNCASCHRQDNQKLVGPGLADATSKYADEWLYKWTTNSNSLIKSGDELAVKVFDENNKTAQPANNLTREEVTAIYKYIDDYNSSSK